MISEEGIANALGQQLVTLSPTPLIAWDNRRPRDSAGTPYDSVPASEKNTSVSLPRDSLTSGVTSMEGPGPGSA